MALRRGFKSEAHEIAREVRRELGIELAAPLDMWTLAAHLEIPVLTLTSYRLVEPVAVRHFTVVESGAFSGVTVFDRRKRCIVYNDRHARTRQASDLAHELAHALLQHAPGAALNDQGCRIWPAAYEEEANWLGAVLLVSEEAALSVVRRGLSLQEAAAEYGISEQMMRWRLNATG